MASPPFLILELKPGDADLISAHPSDERSFRDIVESWLLIDHDTSGLHDKVQLPERADPTLVANVGILYSKDVGGVSELHYIDSAGSVKQITSAGVLLIAAADLPTGVVSTVKIADNAVDGTKIAMGSDVQGDILFYGGTDYERLGADTSGKLLQTKGTSANPVWVTPTLPAPEFTSSEQTVTFDTALNVAHGLGAIPTLVQVVLRCKTTQHGYAVGDEILVSGTTLGDSSSSDQGAVVVMDTTNVTIVQGAGFRILDKTTFNFGVITAGNFKWVVRAWK